MEDMNSLTRSLLIGLSVGVAAVALCAASALLPRRQTPTIKYGMHTLHGDGTELSLVADAGFDWVVQLFSWREIARWRHSYNWVHPDAVVRGAQYYGLNVVARLDQHPRWARTQPAENGPPDDLNDYGDFVYHVARRYKGQIRAYIIWNEPNLAIEWGGQPPDPVAYVEMLKLAYARIKEADPDALVVSAGLAPTNDQSDEALDDRVYLQAMYDAGAKDCFDVLGAHVYGFAYPPDDPHGAHSGLNLARVQDLRRIMEDHHDQDKPIWATESGWTTTPTEVHDWQTVTGEQQAAYLVGAFRRAQQEWPWLELLAVWNTGYGLPLEDDRAGYGLVEPGGELKPAYVALRDMPKRGTFLSLTAISETCLDAVAATRPQKQARALEEDVVIHLGDNHWPTPWVPLYQGQLPSTRWTGEFYVRHPAREPWTLHIDVMQNNERTNYLMVNGRPLEPLYFPVEDYSRGWFSISYSVPADYLQVGLNEVAVVVGKEIPPRHRPGTYEDLQFRDVVLERR